MRSIDNTEGDILEWSMQHYSKLFMNMVVAWDFSHGFCWSIWGKNRPRQINLSTFTETKLTPSDLGVIAIAVSMGDEDTVEQRVAHQYFLINLWIINHDDIEDHARHFMSITRREHITKTYMHHMVESGAKITALRRAYEQLNSEKKWWKLHVAEDRILLGYVISVLWGKYEIRPYMVDDEMTHKESWIEYYDQLFDDFSQESFERYNREWFGRIWTDFMELRNDIAFKKKMPLKHIKVPYQVIQDSARQETAELLKRVR